MKGPRLWLKGPRLWLKVGGRPHEAEEVLLSS